MNARSPVERFAAALAELGGRARRVGSSEALAETLAEIAAERDVREILYAPFGLATEVGLPERLSARGLELVDIGAAGRRAADLEIGLTGAELAVAETGTLLVGGAPGGWGLTAALPWVHIVVMRAADVVDDLEAAFAAFLPRLEGGERDWVWITGPSRSADIGHTLVLGAHGPNSLEILILDDNSEGR